VPWFNQGWSTVFSCVARLPWPFNNLLSELMQKTEKREVDWVLSCKSRLL